MTHTMSILSASGHDTLTWDPVDKLSVAQVEKTFNEMVSKGHLGYVDGKPSVTFDEGAESILVTPFVVGG